MPGIFDFHVRLPPPRQDSRRPPTDGVLQQTTPMACAASKKAGRRKSLSSKQFRLSPICPAKSPIEEALQNLGSKTANRKGENRKSKNTKADAGHARTDYCTSPPANAMASGWSGGGRRRSSSSCRRRTRCHRIAKAVLHALFAALRIEVSEGDASVRDFPRFLDSDRPGHYD